MLEDMQVRNLALNTQESYLQQVTQFARHFRQSPEGLGPEAIRAYHVYLTQERQLAPECGDVVAFINIRSPLRAPRGDPRGPAASRRSASVGGRWGAASARRGDTLHLRHFAAHAFLLIA
jgi:hypothetical protein